MILFLRPRQKALTNNLQEKIDMLSQLPLLRHLTAPQLRAIAFLFTAKSYAPHQVVYRPREPSDFVYFIVDGDCQITRPVGVGLDGLPSQSPQQHGHWQVVATASRGALLGGETALPLPSSSSSSSSSSSAAAAAQLNHGGHLPRAERCVTATQTRVLEIAAVDLLRHINADVMADIRTYLHHTEELRAGHLKDANQVRFEVR